MDLVAHSVAAGDPVETTYQMLRAAAGAEALILAGSVEGRPRLTEPWFC